LRDTQELQGTAHEPLPPPDRTEPWAPSEVWPGGFIRTVDVRRRQLAPGRAGVWVRTDVPLVADEQVSPTSRIVGLLDVANGMTVRAVPSAVLFPNVDLTAHFFDQPQGEWLGLDISVSFGPRGLGLTTSVLHDERGPIGTSSQCLTVRPR